MRYIFGIQIVIALMMLVMSFGASVRRITVTYSFLTRDQLLDATTHHAALETMRRAAPFDATCWLVGGLAVGTTALVGLRLTPKGPPKLVV
jgi:hypothetical protein